MAILHVRVSGEERRITVYVNGEGNLVLEGIGSVNYELLNEELTFTKVAPTREEVAIILNRIMRSHSFLALCEKLDSCGDLLDVGIIDSELEQEIYDKLAEQTAVTVWAIYDWVNNSKKNYDNEYTYTVFVDTFVNENS